MLSYKLTEDIDKGVGQEVTIGVGDVAMIHGTGSNLNVSEDNCVIFHFSADICGGIC